MQRPNLPSILDYFCSLRMFYWFLVGTYDSESFRNTSSFWPKLGRQGQAVKIENIQLFGNNILASLAAQYEIEWELLSHCVVLGGFKRVVQTLPGHVLQKNLFIEWNSLPYFLLAKTPTPAPVLLCRWESSFELPPQEQDKSAKQEIGTY